MGAFDPEVISELDDLFSQPGINVNDFMLPSRNGKNGNGNVKKESVDLVRLIRGTPEQRAVDVYNHSLIRLYLNHPVINAPKEEVIEKKGEKVKSERIPPEIMKSLFGKKVEESYIDKLGYIVKKWGRDNKREIKFAVVGAAIGATLLGIGGWFFGNYNLGKLYDLHKLNSQKDKVIFSQYQIIKEMGADKVQLAHENEMYRDTFKVACTYADLHGGEEKLARTLKKLKRQGLYKTGSGWGYRQWKTNYDHAIANADKAALMTSRKVREACYHKRPELHAMHD